MGYTPAFDTIYTGTLYGRWPAAPVWASLLPLLDRHGHLDMSVEAICGMTGWPRDLLVEGIRQLMEPDPHSRTPGNDGVRLAPLVEGRPWGWRAVNHALYREKARKHIHDERRRDSGENADRMAARRVTRDDPTRPAQTRADPLSDSDTNTLQEQPRERSADSRRGSRVPIPFPLTDELREWAKSETPDIDVSRATAEFVDYWRGVPGQKGCKLDWIATWRNRMRDQQARVSQRAKPKPQKERSEWL